MADSIEAASPPIPFSAKPPKKPTRRFFASLCWATLLFQLALWYVIRTYGDRGWLPTLLLFGPHWLATLPVAFLLPMALIIRRRSLPVLLAAAIVAIFLVDGFCVPWRAATEAGAQGTPLRMLTFNTHEEAVDAPALARFVEATHPDIVALQECTRDTEHQVLGPGWYVARENELVIGSRYPIRDVADLSRPSNQIWGHVMRCEIAAPSGNLYILVLHLLSPHASFRAALYGSPQGKKAIEANSALRERGAEDLRKWVDELDGPVVLAGDFNLPAESPIFRENLGIFGDAFDGGGWGFGWTYRVRGTDARIDHILFNNRWTCHHAWVGPPVGSPHLPLIADLQPIKQK